MKKFLSSLLLSFITTSAIAGISLYDEMSGQYTKFSIESQCAQKLSHLSKEDFRLKEIEDKVVPLNYISDTKFFYHYTNAKPVLTLLAADESDRQRAQSIIETNLGLQEIFQFSYKSLGENNGGRGLYLAGNPYSSLGYGAIQISYKLSSESRIFVLDEDKFNKVVVDFLKQHQMLDECLKEAAISVIKTLLLQESEVDIFYYNRSKGWYVLVNEDVIQETMIIQGMNSVSDMLIKMTKAGRVNEINNYSNIRIECSEGQSGCQKEVLVTMLRYHELQAADKYLKAMLGSPLWRKSYTDLSDIFNQSLIKEDLETVDQLLATSCLIQVKDEKKGSFLADYLVSKAVVSKSSLAKTRKEAVCAKKV